MAKGHVYRRRLKSGKWSSWYAVIDAPRRGNGRRRQITRSFRTQGEAQVWLAEQVRRCDEIEGELLLGDYLNFWLDRQEHLRESTQVSYRRHVQGFLVPKLGPFPLNAVGVGAIEMAYRQLAVEGVSPALLPRIHATLSSALNTAQRDGLIASNPARSIRLKKSEGFQPGLWTADQARAFLRFVTNDELAVVWRLALVLGMRRGEILGLRWRDIDFQHRRMTIRESRVLVSGRVVTNPPKTGRSRRTLSLDAVTVRALKDLHDGLCREPSAEDLVFTDPAGGDGLSPARVSRRFKELTAACGLPAIRFHDLRHTSATLGLSRGESLKEVSTRLGHSSVVITGDIYLQIPDELARRSVQGLADMLDAEREEGAA